MFGDHQADFAFFLVALVGCGDHVHAMFRVEVAGLVVEHVGQVAQRVFGVGGGRLHRLCARQALPRSSTGGFEFVDGFAAQRVEQRGGDEAGSTQVQRHIDGLEDGFSQA
ncbi:hypothetical protein D9M70_648390 [compost metagenome]